MNTIEYKELDFGFSISGCWQHPPDDKALIPAWENESDDLLQLVANKEGFLVCWGDGGTLDSVVGYNPDKIIDIMGKIQTQFGDIQATIYGYGESWDIDTLDNPDDTFSDDILPEIIENQDIMIKENMNMKIESDYRSTGGVYQLCPHCESHWYHSDSDIEWEKVLSEDGDTLCQNCGKLFWYLDDEKTDPKENDVRGIFEEAYHPLPDDEIMVNEIYSAFTDSMCRDGQISSLMYNGMGAFF